MDNLPEHTPLPWTLTGTVHRGAKNIFNSGETTAYHVGSIRSGSKKDLQLFIANTNFIITACNNHYELLKAASSVITECAVTLGNLHNLQPEEATAFKKLIHLIQKIEKEKVTPPRGY